MHVVAPLLELQLAIIVWSSSVTVYNSERMTLDN